MATGAAKFELDEEIYCEGKPVRVAGWVRYAGVSAELLTRYLLAEPGGAPFVVEESGGKFSLLRPFSSGAQPRATGSVIRVMREKYTLSSVRKLKVIGHAGQPPGGIPKAELLVSGLFTGRMGSLLRELPAGAGSQIFFSSKPLGPGEVLSANQYAARREAGRLAAEAAALANAAGKGAGAGKTAQIAALFVAALLVVAGLAYAFLTRPG
jgi:hypothetical protein